jgi:hypothetical protein
VLAGTIIVKSLQMIAGWYPEIVESRCSIELL